MKKYKNFNPDIKNVICRNIRKYRKQKNINIMDMADDLDVSVEHLKRIEAENDRNNISLMTLYKISIILDVEMSKFFEE